MTMPKLNIVATMTCVAVCGTTKLMSDVKNSCTGGSKASAQITASALVSLRRVNVGPCLLKQIHGFPVPGVHRIARE